MCLPNLVWTRPQTCIQGFKPVFWGPVILTSISVNISISISIKNMGYWLGKYSWFEPLHACIPTQWYKHRWILSKNLQQLNPDGTISLLYTGIIFNQIMESNKSRSVKVDCCIGNASNFFKDIPFPFQAACSKASKSTQSKYKNSVMQQQQQSWLLYLNFQLFLFQHFS